MNYLIASEDAKERVITAQICEVQFIILQFLFVLIYHLDPTGTEPNQVGCGCGR